MLKYVETDVTFAEIPNEVTLCINISNCPIHCHGCHSKHLWNDVGEALNNDSLDVLIKQSKGITCVCFMGGDAAPEEIDELAHHTRVSYPQLKIGWYSGHGGFSLFNRIENYDYVKFGPYKKEYGPLNVPTTNQRLYRTTNGRFEDITHLFWR